MITARKLAEDFRGPVMVLSDANLATGQQPFSETRLRLRMASRRRVDLSPLDAEVPPFAWDAETGLSRRPIPGSAAASTCLPDWLTMNTAMSRTIRQSISVPCDMRSRKLAVLQSALKPPAIHGDPAGDLLVVGWGSTLGAIEEAVDRLRAEGLRVSSVHLRFLSPMEPGPESDLFAIRQSDDDGNNYSDELGDPYITRRSRRYSPAGAVTASPHPGGYRLLVARAGQSAAAGHDRRATARRR